MLPRPGVPLARWLGRFSWPDNNLALPLWQLVRASTAAPTFFPPEAVSVGVHDFLFVDEGMSVWRGSPGAAVGSAQSGPGPGPGTSRPRIARPPYPGDSHTARRRRGPSHPTQVGAGVFAGLCELRPGDGEALKNLGFCLLSTDVEQGLLKLQEACLYCRSRTVVNAVNTALALHLLGRDAAAVAVRGGMPRDRAAGYDARIPLAALSMAATRARRERRFCRVSPSAVGSCEVRRDHGLCNNNRTRR